MKKLIVLYFSICIVLTVAIPFLFVPLSPVGWIHIVGLALALGGAVPMSYCILTSRRQLGFYFVFGLGCQVAWLVFDPLQYINFSLFIIVAILFQIAACSIIWKCIRVDKPNAFP